MVCLPKNHLKFFYMKILNIPTPKKIWNTSRVSEFAAEPELWGPYTSTKQFIVAKETMWWLEWAWLPEVHIFEYLVTNWWNCLEELGDVVLLEGRLCRFTRVISSELPASPLWIVRWAHSSYSGAVSACLLPHSLEHSYGTLNHKWTLPSISCLDCSVFISAVEK